MSDTVGFGRPPRRGRRPLLLLVTAGALGCLSAAAAAPQGDMTALSVPAVLVRTVESSSASQSARLAALAALARLGKEAIPYLIGELENKSVLVADYQIIAAREDGPAIKAQTVGEAAEAALYDIVLPAESEYRIKGASLYHVDDWRGWWASHQDKTLDAIKAETGLAEKALYWTYRARVAP